MQIGLPELLFVLFVVFMIFGPKRFLKIGKELGTSVRDIGKSVGMTASDEEDKLKDNEANKDKPSSKEKGSAKK
jgi:Sec-independent protein translocase protein TatA